VTVKLPLLRERSGPSAERIFFMLRVKKSRWFRYLALLAIPMFILAACGGDDEGDSGEGGDGDLPVVKLHALEGGTSAAAIRIIEEQGFDEANGFKGEYFEVSGDASVQFLLQRESDVSFDGDPVTAALLRSQGNEISTFYPLVVQDATMMVRGDAPYDDPSDLEGRKVGHDGLESGTMTAAQIMLDEFEDVQIEGDYDLQLTEEAALIRLVARGDLEATFLGQPEILTAQIDFGMKPIWGPGWQEWEEQRGGRAWNISLMAYEDWLTENPDLAEAVTAAWDDAYEWIKEDPQRLTEDPFPELFGIDNPEVLERFGELVEETEYFTNRWTEEDIQAARDFIEFAADIGTVIQEAPEGSVVSLDELNGG
jgi:NitT/TauT family transport system substrate-binding protein